MRGFFLVSVLAATGSCVDRSDGVSVVESDPAVCEEGAQKSDGCSPCWCYQGQWRCGETACTVGLGDAAVEGPRCYPICPEEVDPEAIRESLDCIVVVNDLGHLAHVAPCDEEADGCFRVRADRLGLTASPDDDVAAQCLALGNGIEIELVGLDDFEGNLEASCTLRFATTYDACASE